ncbi:Dolichyl-phosphate-mannose-protein mannosyltransferase [Sphingomonas palmae]|uniref:Dolichyl-phosphate-mannose-protein mannosyltransferase n=1 Tax=Sphingomonas palmae TaxID=1855283 RepID=A0A1H7U6R4_9SPHN|nr:glycosyltransferase family 39 protein [Sphingomonas palmae]SEL92416.1 Dolichyl-phosphate-mannose-protein mannosyltransferase [Sphingomonas palmae]
MRPLSATIDRRDRLLLALIFVLALIIRIGFALAMPYDSGDWVLYRNVAENIYRGCGVAVTIPGVGDCVPHFGGNQLPLFPAFAAAVWHLSGHSNVAILLVQSLLSAASIAYLTYAVRRTFTRPAALLAGVLLACSPVGAIYAGNLETELLTLAATNWVLAELLLSIEVGRLRTWPLALALTVAVWLRMDSVLLLAPVALVAYAIGPKPRLRRAITSWGVVTAIVAASCLAWSARNVAVGLPALPRPWVKTDGTYLARGYTDWVTTWVVGQQERGDALYYDPRDTRHFRLPDHAYSSPEEHAEVDRLLAITRATPGTTIPPLAAAGFEHLARVREAGLDPVDRVRRFAARTRALSARWFWPFAQGVGDGRDRVSVTDLYRFALTLAVLLAAAIGSRRTRLFAAASVLYASARVIFFAAGANTELRYLVELSPFFELTAALIAAELLARLALPRSNLARGAATT